MTPGGHPTDADREDRVRPLLGRVVAALAAGDGDAFAATLRRDAAWLGLDGTVTGETALHRARSFAAGADRAWAEPQCKGAHAALRWTTARDGTRGALVLEMRAEAVVMVVETP